MCGTTLQWVSITDEVSNVALSVNLSRNTYFHVMLSVFTITKANTQGVEGGEGKALQC